MTGRLTDIVGQNQKLMELMAGKPVALRFTERGVVVLLTPGPVYGFSQDALVIAGLGAKCGIIDLREVKVTPMLNAGLSASAARVLQTELQRAYEYANTTIEG